MQTKTSIVTFIFVKYVIFFIFLMVLRNDYRLISNGLVDGVTFFIIFMLPLPALMALIFTFPLFYVFRMKISVFFILAITGMLVLEYFLYTILASTQDLINGIYNGSISVLFGLIFFGIRKRLLLKGRKVQS